MELLDFAVELAAEAGALAVERRGAVSCTSKPDGTWVTEADQAAEELIRSRLAAACPGHSVYGEEMGGHGDIAVGNWWLVDPIDGTNNYITGLPSWGVSLGLAIDGEPALGVFHSPVTGETFSGGKGLGAFLNGMPICPDRRGFVDTNSLVALNSDAFDAFEHTSVAKPRNLGSSAAHVCYVVSGGLSAVLVDKWKVWDVAAGLAIAFEAGVEARYLDGTRLTGFHGLAPAAGHPAIVVGPGFALDAIIPHIIPRQG